VDQIPQEDSAEIFISYKDPLPSPTIHSLAIRDIIIRSQRWGHPSLAGDIMCGRGVGGVGSFRLSLLGGQCKVKREGSKQREAIIDRTRSRIRRADDVAGGERERWKELF
jgi:hypothetical protein